MSHIITGLEVQQRNTDRVSVFLDGEFAFGLPSVEAARLREGQTLTEDEVARLRALDEAARAFDRAALLLARRPYSISEIRRYLRGKDIPPAALEDAVQRLADLGYVDDRAFAQFWVENRERFRPRGPRALRQELRQKGIAEEIIGEALAGVDAEESAYRAAQDQVRRLRGQPRDMFRSRIGAFLVRRGFGYDTARDVTDRLIRELEEEDPDTFDTAEPDEE